MVCRTANQEDIIRRAVLTNISCWSDLTEGDSCGWTVTALHRLPAKHACDDPVNFGNIRRKENAFDLCMSGAEDRVAGERPFSIALLMT